MKDWGPLGAIIDLAFAVAATLAVCWLVGILWLALQQLAALWPLVGLLLAGVAWFWLVRRRGRS